MGFFCQQSFAQDRGGWGSILTLDYVAYFVKGLEQCVHLEELILNNNLIKKIEGLYLMCVCMFVCMHVRTHVSVFPYTVLG